MRRFIIGLAAAGLLVGCQTVSYRTDLPGGGRRHLEPAGFFFWGLAGDKIVRLDRICPEGVARWQNQQTFVDAFLGVITFGIYVPRTIFIECAAYPPPPTVPPAPETKP